jgi:hypothetical protein
MSPRSQDEESWEDESEAGMASNNDDDGGGGGDMCPHCGSYMGDCDCPKELEVPKDFPLLTILPPVLSWDTKTLSLDSVTIRNSLARLVYSTSKDYPALTWGETLNVLYRGVQWDNSYLHDILQEDKMQNWLSKKHMWPPLKRSATPGFVCKGEVDPVAVADAASMSSSSSSAGGVGVGVGSVGGLSPRAGAAGLVEMECPVCGEEQPAGHFLHAGCGHFFCKGCWGKRMSNAVTTQGGSAIYTTCMFAGCERPVPLDLVTEHGLLPADQLEKLVLRLVDHFLVHSDDDYQLCPRPVSECPVYAVKCQNFPPEEIRCCCNAKWCYQCRTKDPTRTESHYPLSCDNYDRWRSLGNDHTIAAGIAGMSKPCPQCQVAICRDLLNEGCLHMTCTNCKAHFCWECLRTPYPHGADSDFFTCPEVERRRQTEEGNAQYLRQQREVQVATWYVRT